MTSSAHYDAFRSRKYFGSLDGLRALSILAVIWYHGPGQTTQWILLGAGQQGVQLFFAISGFLITTLLLRERDATGDISLGRFYARRSLRIFPLYYTLLLVYTVIVLADGREAPQFVHNLRYFLTYTANWFVPGSAVFGFVWSLATEEQFYCVWPSCEKYLKGKWAVALIGTILALRLALRSNWSLQWISKDSFFRTVGEHIALPICLGVMLAHLLNHRRGYEAVFPWIGFRYASALSMLAVAAAIQFRAQPLVVAAALTLIVATCVIREDHGLAAVLSNRVLVQIGMVSYGAYMMHGLVYNAVEAIGNRLGLDRHGVVEFVATTVLTVALASLSFRYYESYFLRLKKRFQVVGSKGTQAGEVVLPTAEIG